MLDPRTSAVRIFALTATAISGALLPAQTPQLVITRVNVVDVINGRVIPARTVTISGKTITSVAGSGSPPDGARVVDGQGKYLIPGLWDMHAHTEMTGEASLQLEVANGVTGIRDMGSDLNLILKLRERTSLGEILGPRIFAAGPILDDAPEDWPFRMRVKTAGEGKAAVESLARRGVDLIKVHDHTPREAYFAIAAEARKQRLPLAGHLPLTVTAEEAIDAGQADIEHLSNLRLWQPCSGGAEYRPEDCRAFFEMLARRGVSQTPTLAFWFEVSTIGTPASAINPDRYAYANKTLKRYWAEHLASMPPETARYFSVRAPIGARVAKDMVSAGVNVMAGCDGVIPGFCVQDELSAMVRGGMTTAEALRTATINPARHLGLEKTNGSVEPGRAADLVLLDASPLDAIANVGKIRAVIIAGRLLDRDELDDVLEGVRAGAAAQSGEEN